MGTLSTTKPRSRQISDCQKSHANGVRYVNVNGIAEKVYTVDDVFLRIEKNLNDFYGTNYKLE